MNIEQTKILGETVGFTVGASPNKVAYLLKKYGDDPTGLSKADLISKSIDLISTNDAFAVDFMKLAKESAKQFNRVVQETPFSSADGSTDWGALSSSLLSSATDIFTTFKTTDAQRKLAEQQAKITAQQTEGQIALGQLNLEAEKLKLAQIQASSSTAGSSKILIIGGVVLVVLLIGGAMLMAFKNKK